MSGTAKPWRTRCHRSAGGTVRSIVFTEGGCASTVDRPSNGGRRVASSAVAVDGTAGGGALVAAAGRAGAGALAVASGWGDGPAGGWDAHAPSRAARQATRTWADLAICKPPDSRTGRRILRG